MKIPSFSAGMALFLCEILLCIIPSMIIHHWAEDAAFEKHSRSYAKKMKKQISWRKRVSLRYLFAVSDAKEVTCRVRWVWRYWGANFCCAILLFLCGVGIIHMIYGRVIHCFKMLADGLIYVSWASKHGKYNK